MLSLSLIVLAALIGIFAYLFIPDHSPNANRQMLEIATRHPDFRVSMLKVHKNSPEVKSSFFSLLLNGTKSNFREIPLESWHFQGARIKLKVYDADNSGRELTIDLADVVYPLIGKQKQIGNEVAFQSLDGKHHRILISQLQQAVIQHHLYRRTFYLGTDQFGRDLLSRLLLGVRISLSVGFIAVAISLLVGILLGSLAGYYRGWVDELIMWFINVVWSIPTLLLVIAITFALGKGFWQIFVAVGLTMWVEVARVVRGQMLSMREEAFVEAGFSMGFSGLRIMGRHILPNILSPVIVISAANFASAILIEAGLSFLGIGVQPPIPSWGNMIKEYYSFIVLHSAYLALIPGIAIVILVLAFMTLGNSLRDAMDVKLQHAS